MDSLFLIIGYLLGISSGVILNKGILSKSDFKCLQILIDRKKIEIYFEGRAIKSVRELIFYLSLQIKSKFTQSRECN